MDRLRSVEQPDGVGVKYTSAAAGGDEGSVANNIRPMSETRPNKAALRARLSQLKMCK